MTYTDNANDLQLEDVEDYTADYPPSGFPNAESNMAPMGNSDDVGFKSSSPKYRRSAIIAQLRKNKWTVALLGVVIIVLIGVLAAVVGKDNSTPPPSSSTETSSEEGVPPPVVDATSLDQDVLAVLKASIQSVYVRHGLDKSLLEESMSASPQRKALLWMASDKSVNSIEHTEKLQLYVLAVFFYSTNMVVTDFTPNPQPWRAADKWLTNAHSCSWLGVVCNENKEIVEINLERNRLSGKIPLELILFGPHLTSLDLTNNLIVMSGSDFDVFRNLTNFKSLHMDDNYLYYDKGLPPQFKHMSHMEKIRLSYNLFEGELDSETNVLGSMHKLTHLEMESNFLTGTMPSAIGNMSQLVYLYLRRNDMKFNLDFMKTGHLGNLCTQCIVSSCELVGFDLRSPTHSFF
jgi:hypothetical protein